MSNSDSEIDLATFFQRIREFVGWSEQDAEWVRRAWPHVQPAVPAAIEEFYQNILRFPFTNSVITGGAPQVARLKRTLVGWIETLFSGQYDMEFAESRWRVGRRHVEIGLHQSYAMGALARLRININRQLMTGQTANEATAGPTAAAHGNRNYCPAECIISVNKLLDIDAAIIEFAYQEHYGRSLREAAAEKLRQTERLASIGQMVTGLAHESRNALQRSGACLEALLLEIEDRPEAQRQAIRIQSALDHLNVLYEEVRNYAAPIRLDLEAVPLLPSIQSAWQHLRPLWQDSGIRFELVVGEKDPPLVLADVHRLEQVLNNLFQNAIQATGPRGTVQCLIECRADTAHLHVGDSGPGIPDDVIDRVFDPFFTTKSKGTGLGLAITRRIVQAHGGEIEAGRSLLGGARFSLSLPLCNPEAEPLDPHSA